MNCKALLNIAIEIALYKCCIIIIIINSGHTDEQTRQKIDIKKLYQGINSKRY